MDLKNLIIYLSVKDEPLQAYLESKGAVVAHSENYRQDETDINAHLVVFPGGGDVSPFLYGERKGRQTMPNIIRDMFENRLYRRLDPEMPKIGIGRGAQFLNIMAGGSMYQYVSGHTAQHTSIDYTSGNQQVIQSCHHQEMIPPKDANILLVASAADRKTRQTKEEHFDHVKNMTNSYFPDTEAVHIERTRALCFQPRPEYKHTNTTNLFEDYVTALILPHVNKMYKAA